MRRASKGICANIAEGHSKQIVSQKEYARFISMAIGSANELIVWIKFCFRLKYVDQSLYDNWRDGYDHIAKMLNKLKPKI